MDNFAIYLLYPPEYYSARACACARVRVQWKLLSCILRNLIQSWRLIVYYFKLKSLHLLCGISEFFHPLVNIKLSIITAHYSVIHDFDYFIPFLID
jgi:hypothetical protein